MPLILGANSVTGGYEIDNSLRFNTGSSDYLSKTYSVSPTSRTTMTISAWVKRGNIGTGVTQVVVGTDGNYEAPITFYTDDTLRITGPYDAGQQGIYETNAVYRDVSAWYHIVTQYDTTNATAGDRMKLYVNGERITSFSLQTNSNQNNTTSKLLVSGETSFVGQSGSGAYFDGYIAETYIIDGQALDPDNFGEFDSATGIWKPIAYTGTYGTNGFYLEFKDSSALGDDTSGNGNDFTVNNLTSIDQTTDTPTNNFATGNPLIPSTLTYTDGNCTIQRTTSDWESTGSTLAVTQGKWYAEFKWISGTFTIIGVEDMELVSIWDNEFIGKSINGRGYGWDGDARNNSSASAFGNSFTTGDIIGVALDMDNKYVYMSKNGTFQNSGDPTSGGTGTGGLSLSGTEYIIGWSAYNSVISANFGNPPFTISSGNSDANGYGNFEYAVPSGYYALNTKNLAEYG
jgi:hypothetical protein